MARLPRHNEPCFVGYLVTVNQSVLSYRGDIEQFSEAVCSVNCKQDRVAGRDNLQIALKLNDLN